MFRFGVSPKLKELLQKMLTHNPIQRITLEEVCEHAWLAEVGRPRMSRPTAAWSQMHMQGDLYVSRHIIEFPACRANGPPEDSARCRLGLRVDCLAVHMHSGLRASPDPNQPLRQVPVACRATHAFSNRTHSTWRQAKAVPQFW